MSIVITTVSLETTVQVSDTRLTTFSDQSVVSETQRKTLVALGKKARFVVGWVGLAADGASRHHTGEFLVKTLHGMDAVELTIDEIALRLQSAATTAIADLQAADKRLSFVMAGWQDSEPFVATVSNHLTVSNTRQPDEPSKMHHIPKITEATVAAPTFTGDIQRFNNVTEINYLVNVAGDFDPEKLKTPFIGLERLLKNHATASEISGACRQIALEASTHTKTIGRTVIGVELTSSGKSTCTFYSENEAAAVLVPPILDSSETSTGATITLASDELARLDGKFARRAG